MQLDQKKDGWWGVINFDMISVGKEEITVFVFAVYKIINLE